MGKELRYDQPLLLLVAVLTWTGGVVCGTELALSCVRARVHLFSC